jgi:DNA-binding transcriptional LysR family regulator/8-oxo-dGTP pyrophosphatase MutT (NUDIX family)
MLDVHRLRLLRELDRLGTLASVARALSYSPSAVSQQLSQLETETGVTLLESAGRGVRLTAQARILVAHTEAILERLEEAEADLRASLTEVRGTLRVASFQSVLLALVPEVLTTLASRHPGLRVEITHQDAGEAFAGLLARDFDVVLGEEYPGAARPPVPGARTRLLASDELFLVLPAHGPYARAESATVPARLPDLAEVPWIFDAADTAPGQWVRDTCRAAGFEPDVRYTGSDLLLQIHLAETGHAAAVIPGLLLAAVPPPAARVRALPGHPRRKLTTGVRSGAAADPAIRAFRAALSEAINATATHPAPAPKEAQVTPIDKIAWIRLEDGKILSTRSRGKDVYYLPGGKREPGETDVQTLVREIREELDVAIAPDSARHAGTFEAQAHGHSEGITVRMTCYTADYQGIPAPSSEIDEVIWLTYADRDRVAPVDQVIFDHLHQSGELT